MCVWVCGGGEMWYDITQLNSGRSAVYQEGEHNELENQMERAKFKFQLFRKRHELLSRLQIKKRPGLAIVYGCYIHCQ